MNLVVDVGNSTVKTAIFNKKGELKSHARFDDPTVSELLHWVAPHQVEKAILSSSGYISPSIQEFMGRFTYLIFESQLKFPITINYKYPSKIGKDRIAGAVAIWHKFPEVDSLYIDMGTCITYNLIKTGGIFEGGAISPGINMRLEAMHKFTKALPEVNVEGTFNFPVFDTKNAMRAGAIQGAIFEIEQFIVSFQNKYKINNVIITGGDAYIFGKSSNFKIFVHPNLVLEGLNEILEYNVQ